MKYEHAEELANWFNTLARDFPWRVDKTPYRVLVSEIMLQQTRAAAAVPFYERWMRLLPDFQTLSKASDLEVMKLWEGLGYYSRARNLRQIAVTVMEQFGGTFPSDQKQILSFKGIGPYTAAAISHFAFNRRVLGADGNIIRVIARFYGVSRRVDRGNEVIELLDQFLPPKNSHKPFEALIELGATVCTKKPKCTSCPLMGNCKAFNEQLTDVIPVVKPKPKVEKIFRTVFVIEMDGAIVIKRESKKLMNGLYEFPYVEMGSCAAGIKIMEQLFSCKLEKVQEYKEVVHFFTKYKASLYPIQCRVSGSICLPNGYELVCKEMLGAYPFSAGHRKILAEIVFAR